MRVSPKSSPFERKGKKDTLPLAHGQQKLVIHIHRSYPAERKNIYKNEITQENAGVNSKHTVQK